MRSEVSAGGNSPERNSGPPGSAKNPTTQPSAADFCVYGQRKATSAVCGFQAAFSELGQTSIIKPVSAETDHGETVLKEIVYYRHKRIPNARTESTPRNRRATALPSPTASISRRHSRRVATSCTNIWCIRERTVWKTNKRTSGSRNNLDRSQGQPPIGPPDHAATKGPAGAFLLELPRNYWSYEFHESTETDQLKASTYLKRWPRLLEGKPSLAPRRRSWAVNATTPVRPERMHAEW
ncbi:uncharacterized protein LOC115269139 [Aedes albopictus]|uniref:Uncharacterized protein n=1 Tax=Aedes albopictus TaxID=7160 RepID=A0ABM1XJW1_AEDAL